MSHERRKAPRLDASLQVQVLGKERRAHMRRGDFSVTGLRLDHPGVDIGTAGTTERLRLSSRDGCFQVEVLARVVRVERVEDLSGHRVRMVGFEFLPANEEQREEIAMLFVHIASAQLRLDERGLRRASEPPGIQRQTRTLSLETDWQLRKGESVGVQLPGPEGARMAFLGVAVRSRRGKKGTFRTTVHFDAAEGCAIGPTSTAEHMHGDLSQFRAPSLLSLAAVERMTGEFYVSRDDRAICVFLRDGQIVDAEEQGSDASRRRLLGELCQWESGFFELRLCDVDRADGIGVPTPTLLLQLAQLQDEARRVA